MSLALSGIQVKVGELMEVVYPRLEGVTQTLRDVSATRLTPIVTAAQSNLQKILYSDLTEPYLSIALATWNLSTTALLSFWFGWTLGVNLYHLGLWLARSAPRRQHRPRIAKGVSAAKVELAGGPHSLKAEKDIAPQASGETNTTCKETPCVADTAAGGPKHTSSTSPVPENNVADVEITTASIVKAGTPDPDELEHDASALSIPVRITRSGKYATPAPTGAAGDIVGLFTPPSTPARSEVRGAQLGTAEADAKTPLGTTDACPTIPTQAAGKERRRSKRTAYKPHARPTCAQAEAEIN